MRKMRKLKLYFLHSLLNMEDQKPKKTLPKNNERCMHITEKGERCKNKKESDGSEHCHIHSGNPKKVLTKKTSPPKETLEAKPKKSTK